jgi:hypothetical protein
MKKLILIIFSITTVISFAQKSQFGQLIFDLPPDFVTDKGNNALYFYNLQKQLSIVIYTNQTFNGNLEETIHKYWNTKEKFPGDNVGEIARLYNIESNEATGLRADYESEDMHKTVLAYEYEKTVYAVITYTIDRETNYAVENFLKSLHFVSAPKPIQLTPLERSYRWYKALRGPDATNASIQVYQSLTTINFTGFNAASQNHLQTLGDSLFYLKELPTLQTILIGQTRLNDAAAINIGMLPAIKHVQSVDQGLLMPVTNAGMVGLSRAGTIETLDLRAVDIPGATDASLAQLRNLARLKKLIFSRATNITINGIEQLTTLKELQELNLSYSAVSDADVPRLIAVIQQLPALRILFLQTTGITEAGAAQIRQTFSQLTFYR